MAQTLEDPGLLFGRQVPAGLPGHGVVQRLDDLQGVVGRVMGLDLGYGLAERLGLGARRHVAIRTLRILSSRDMG